MKANLAPSVSLLLIIWISLFNVGFESLHAQSPVRTLADARAGNALWMASATEGWQVGDNGLIRKTVDGGTTWALQSSGTTVTLRGVWGFGVEDVWAVGDGGTILYWDGTEWFDHSVATAKDDWYAIDGSDFDDIWVVGFEGAVMHWNGTSWARTAPAVATGTTLRSVWAVSATSVWAVGDLGLIMRWNGTAWSDQSVATLANLYAVSGKAGSGLILVAGENGLVMKWNGTTWATTSTTGTSKLIRGLTVQDATHAWAVAEDGVMRFYNGTTWSAQSVGGTTASFHGVQAMSTTSVFAVGDRGLQGHFNGSAWAVSTAGTPNVNLNDVWAVDSGDVWMVGDAGVALRYYNGAIVSTSTGVFTNLNSVWGLNDGTRWAVGDGGTILRWNGSAWAQEASGVSAKLNGVWASAQDDVWAVGAAGTILHWDGSLWTQIASGTKAELRGIWGDSLGEIWAVGAGGVVRNWDGSGWVAQTSGVKTNLNDVWGTSPTNVMAVGAGGQIRRYNGLAWSNMNSGVTVELQAVGGTDATNTWAVGADQVISRKGTTWGSVETNSAATALLGVAATTAESAFFVGKGGTVFTNLPDPSPEISVEQPVGNGLFSGASSVDFGAKKLGVPRAISVTLRNTGNDDLTGLALTLSGAESDDYIVEELAANTLAPQATATFIITFTSSANGVRLAKLVIASNDLDEPVFSVVLTGKGLVPTTIVNQPEDTAVNPGDQATFTVVVDGSPPFTYQWRKDGIDIPDANEASYTIAKAMKDDEGAYDCIINSEEGTAVTSAEATLSVNDPVSIDVPPTKKIALGGATVSFNVTAIGSEPITYQWLRNGRPIDGATESSFTIPVVQLSLAGEYSVKVKNPVNEVTSTPASLVVVDVAPRTLCLPVGAALTSITVTSSKPATSYTWGKDGGPLPADYRYTGWTGRALSIKQLKSADAGDITCTVEVDGVSVTTTTNVIIYSQKPSINFTGAMPFAMVGCDYQFQIPVVLGNAQKPTSFSATGLPTGLKIDTKTGLISGYPTIALSKDKTYAVTLVATNALGSSQVTTTLVLKALPTGTIGSYAGPISRDLNLNHDLGGSLALMVASNGALTGKLTLGALSASLKGSLTSDASGSAPSSGSISVPAIGDLSALVITFDVDPNTNRLVNGDITNGTDHASFTAWRKKWGTAMPATELAELRSHLGRFNFGMELNSGAPSDGSVPEGLSYGSFVVATTGALTVAGKLADGTVYSSATFCGPAGEVFIYQPLYGKKGSILGTLNITPGNPAAVPAYADSTLSGTSSWLRPATSTRVYADGFSAVDLDVVGARYIAPSGKGIVMGLVDTGSENAQLAFGPQRIVTQDLPDIDFRIKSIATVVPALVNPRMTRIAIVPTTGLFSGGYSLEDQDPSTPGSNVIRPGTFSGIITSSGSSPKGVGFFLLAELPAADSGDTVLTSKILSGPVVLTSK